MQEARGRKRERSNEGVAQASASQMPPPRGAAVGKGTEEGSEAQTQARHSASTPQLCTFRKNKRQTLALEGSGASGTWEIMPVYSGMVLSTSQ